MYKIHWEQLLLQENSRKSLLKKMTFQLNLSSTRKKEKVCILSRGNSISKHYQAMPQFSCTLNGPIHLPTCKLSPIPAPVMRWLSDIMMCPRSQRTKWSKAHFSGSPIYFMLNQVYMCLFWLPSTIYTSMLDFWDLFVLPSHKHKTMKTFLILLW